MVPPPERRNRELETGRLVERAVRSFLDGRPGAGAGFLAERARADVAGLEPSPAERALCRVVAELGTPVDREELAAALVSYAGALERYGEDPEPAVGAYETALAVRPESPTLMLHAARANRKSGHRKRALVLYRRVRKRTEDRLARFSALGEALLADAPEEAINAVLRASEAAGDAEAAAVALEERARARWRSGRLADAADDLLRSGLRYDHRDDRLRVARTLGELLFAAGHLDAAREALWTAEDLAGPGETASLVGRLRAVARDQGDEVGLRRWQPVGPSPVVEQTPTQEVGDPSSGFVDVIRGWRESLVCG